MTTVLITHPSADRYGSDLQLLETVSAFVSAGHTVRVVLPDSGPLTELLRARGATVSQLRFPVVRKSMLSLGGLLRLAWQTLRSMPGMWRELRADREQIVWVNTVTAPLWIMLARAMSRRTITHVHEAEEDGPKWARWALALPVSWSHRIVANSQTAADVLVALAPRIAGRITVVHNGMPGPTVEPGDPAPRSKNDPAQIALVARISPRKGIDIAIEAVSLLRAEGRDVTLTIAGTAFEGYEWFENECRERAARQDLNDAVKFVGYVADKWSLLANADVVLVPSRVEPFGNTAVEAFLARRPLVASRTQGLREIVTDGATGLLVQPGNAAELASAIARLLDDYDLAIELARAGQAEAQDRFSPATYAAGVLGVLTD